MEDTKTTHIIVRFPSTKSENLFRADNGMLLAARAGNMVRFGTDPQRAESCLFIDDEAASRHLRSLAGPDAVFAERDGEPRILPANGALHLRN